MAHSTVGCEISIFRDLAWFYCICLPLTPTSCLCHRGHFSQRHLHAGNTSEPFTGLMLLEASAVTDNAEYCTWGDLPGPRSMSLAASLGLHGEFLSLLKTDIFLSYVCHPYCP